jgi:hypothetical protein
MSLWFHSTILATSLAATVAVGLASAAIYKESSDTAAKSDRLPIAATTTDETYMTVETRQDGVSVLNRVPLTDLN